MKTICAVCFLSIFIFASCSKDNAPAYNTGTKSTLSIEFDNIVGTADLELNAKGYTNAAGETFSVTKLRYYVSNFVFTSKEGDVYTVPQDSCYFLIDESDESTHEPVVSLPEGEYKTVSFMIGVDSLRSTMALDKRIGVLDPAAAGGDMYWGWNSGYIFFKMEGQSAAAGMGGEYAYHVGGFGGLTSPTINNIKTVTLDLSARGEPIVKAGLEPNIHLMVDILKVFNGNTPFSIADHPMVMFDDFSTTIANNYSDMIRHDHTEN